MPTYSYRCEKCGVFDKFHGINDEVKECPTCGGEVNRIIGKNLNFLLKGPGFYSTDNPKNESVKKATMDNHIDQHVDHKREKAREANKTVACGN